MKLGDYNKREGRSVKCTNPFTLIEVTMAMGVMAIGMMGVLALFPIGLNASRDAVGDYYSSMMAEQFLNVIAIQCKNYKNLDPNTSPEVDGWNEWVLNNTKISETKPTSDGATKGSALGAFSGIYETGDIGIYRVETKTGNIVDFAGDMSVWKDKITYDNDGNPTDIDKKYGVKLCLEVSWPVNKPYSKREKRSYVLEIFNPVER